MKREYWFLFWIIVLAYLLRILPYLLGYPIPITEDSIIDFQQVQHIIENNKINFSHPYGAFPILHLIVFFIAKLGFNPLNVFLFIPQIFPSVGIFFFYLFLKKYFPKRESLFACFLIAVFGPHIYWSSQPVRETIGLFFFPVIIYLFDKYINDKKTSVLLLLLISFLLLVFSHNWSTFMAVFFLFVFSLFFIKENKKYAFLLTGIFLIIALIYWSFVFKFAFIIATTVFNFLFPFFVGTLLFIILIFFLKKIDMNIFKTRFYMFVSAIVLIIFVFLILNVLSFVYPIQVWIMFFVFLILGFLGFFYTKNGKVNLIFMIVLSYSIFLIISILSLIGGLKTSNFPFDSLRILEFAIFPFSVIASAGFFIIWEKLKIKYFLIISIPTLIILGTFIYPPIFIYKVNFQNTIFYDVRSDIRYIPQEGLELIDIANKEGYSVVSNSYVINHYQDAFYEEKEDKLLLITEQDYRISEKYEKIKDSYLGINNPKMFINKTKNVDYLYSNDWGKLYDLDIFYVENKKVKKYYGFVDVKRNDSAFCVTYAIPEKVIVGKMYNVSITVKNIGNTNWTIAEKYKLGSSSPKDNEVWEDELKGELNHRVNLMAIDNIFPGQEKTFNFTIVAPANSGKYSAKWQMLQEHIYWFGEECGRDVVIVENNLLKT